MLHWHLVDSQSSPMEYFKNPLFLVTQYGAYDKTKIYRQDRIKELVAYANFKGSMTSLWGHTSMMSAKLLGFWSPCPF